MDKQKFTEAIKKAKESKKRKFSQAIDLVIALTGLDVKGGLKIEEFITLPHTLTKKKVCALVGLELKPQAEKTCDKVIAEPDFGKWTSKKELKKLSRDYDYFIAQANIMPIIAKTFGKYLGVSGKMPNPKAGQIVPPNAKLETVVPRLRAMTKIVVAKNPTVNCKLGTEADNEELLAENAAYIVDHLIPKLPQSKSNIRKIMIKTTMGKPEVVQL